MFLNRFAIALIDELVTSVLLVTAGCSAILLARHRPFLGFLGFSFFSFSLVDGAFLELGLFVLCFAGYCTSQQDTPLLGTDTSTDTAGGALVWFGRF